MASYVALTFSPTRKSDAVQNSIAKRGEAEAVLIDHWRVAIFHVSRAF
jgi:hypothetical protein